ncbi:MAG: ATP-dependent RNA helicase HrpA, partial [Acidimicrobiales bacterium]
APGGEAHAALLGELAGQIDAAAATVAARRAGAPRPRYPSELPITAKRTDILDALAEHQVLIVAGETGSGKSTQLPKMCLEAGRGAQGMIGHTQPRRIAARTVAERVADELGVALGGAVGYTVRFTDRVGERTLVKVMTDGILLAEIQRDRDLLAYDTLIIDEAHERSLNIDFILGYLKSLLPRRPDLKVIVTSATIDTARFAEHFGGAPVIHVSGRAYPVEVRWRPLDGGADGLAPGEERDQIQGICDAVEELRREGPGDVLVFLSGEREIRDTADALTALRLSDTEILPLYARLSAAEQHRVFQAHRGRRVVLATNVAETSLTVPGVRYVVDPGTARISRFNRRTKVQRLPIEAVSQASANQRAGRCGRVAPGVCIRLYSEADFLTRPEFTEPEILRTNLASVILQMAALGLGDLASFPFVEPPDSRSIADGIATLVELGALDPDAAGTRRWLTPLGRRLAQLPVDPRLGRMILEAEQQGCVREVMVITAALSIQDPRERPADKAQAAAQSHARFTDRDSDFLAYLNLWRHLQEQQAALSSSQFRRLCRAEHLNYLRVREWQDIDTQLRQLARSLGLAPVPRALPAETHPERVHRALLAGLLSHIGQRDGERSEFVGARNARFAIAPGSALARRPPRWVMAAELVETNRLWGRVAARIQPEWAETLGAHLVKRTYGEAQWDPARGAASVTERVSLYGLPIVSGRRVELGRVDPPLARALFIQHALVEGDWTGRHAFLEHNEAKLAEVRALEERVRRRDILVDDDALFAFYDARVGPEVTSARRFDHWWAKRRRRDPYLLELGFETLVDRRGGPVRLADYPLTWRQGEHCFPLTYRYDHSAPDDGVSVHLPLAVLNQVSAAGFEWLAPGLRAELVTALIRGLPKALRRSFAPAPDHAAAVLARVSGPADGPLAEVLTRELRRLTGVSVPLDAWAFAELPGHLRMTFCVVDEAGAVIASGKDLGALRRALRGRLRAALADAAGLAEQTGLRAWTVGELPAVVETVRNGLTVRAYPALVDEGDSVALRQRGAAAEPARARGPGVRRLLRLGVASPARELKAILTRDPQLVLAASGYGSTAALVEDCIDCALDQLIAERGGPPRDEAGFEALRAAARAE